MQREQLPSWDAVKKMEMGGCSWGEVRVAKTVGRRVVQRGYWVGLCVEEGGTEGLLHGLDYV